jgi:uncharacterized membrane protein
MNPLITTILELGYIVGYCVFMAGLFIAVCALISHFLHFEGRGL